MDEPIRPLFVTETPEPGGLHSNGKIAKLTGLSVRRLKEFQTARLVHVRDLKNTGQTAWNMSARSDVAAFVLLSQIRDTIGANMDILRAASIGLYGWRVPCQEALPWYPVLHALYAAANDQTQWCLRVRFETNDQTGQHAYQGYCYDLANPPRYDHKSPWRETGSLSIDATTPLVRLVAAFRQSAQSRYDA